MNNGHVVAAFRVSGDAPSKGARITELLLIKLSDAGKEIERLMLPENAMLASTDGSLTPDVFSRLVEFVNDHPVVTHDGYNWKRFLRQEFASQSKDQVKHFLARTVDVSEWTQRTYPKQRKDIDSLCKRLKIVVAPSLVGLEREVEVITKMLPHLDKKIVTSGEKELRQTLPKISTRKKRLDSFSARLQRAWGILRGSE